MAKADKNIKSTWPTFALIAYNVFHLKCKHNASVPR